MHRRNSEGAFLIGLSFFIFQLIAFVELNGRDAIKNYRTFGIAFAVVNGVLILGSALYLYWQRHSSEGRKAHALVPYGLRSVRTLFYVAHTALWVLYSIWFLMFAEKVDHESAELEEIGVAGFSDRQLMLGSFSSLIVVVVWLTTRYIAYMTDHQKHGYKAC